MYQIKQKPEDFIVKEINSLKLSDKGKYAYFRLKKTSYTTLRALEHIATALRIERKKLSFAGTKDKIAQTEQTISACGIKKEQLEQVKLKDLQIEFLGYSDQPISLGGLDKNEFEIVIRNLEKIKPIKQTKFVNYFGEQRFSTRNHLIGKAIIQSKIKEAVQMITETEGDIEEKVKDKIENNKNDYVGALRAIDRKLLLMYIHSYSSWIWNKAAEELLKKGQKEQITIPLLGFSTELGEDEASKTIKKIMNEEKITQRDFIIRPIPELTCTGDTRELYAEAEDLEVVEQGNDDFNEGKKKIRIKFKLKKGIYATEYIKQVFG